MKMQMLSKAILLLFSLFASASYGAASNTFNTGAAECLFNWAESNYPALFAPAVSLTNTSGVYTYRYYSATKSYLAVSSGDGHVYYLGPDGSLRDEGALSAWVSQTGCQVPAVPPVDCLFNWAESNYPALFAPAGSLTAASGVYTYRYYPAANAYLGVSSVDYHVYYLGPDGSLHNEGTLSDWLPRAGCQSVLGPPPPVPVIFIHGLASSAESSWGLFISYLTAFGWNFGGIPVYDPISGAVNIDCTKFKCAGGNFYALSFSSNQNLSFAAQGGELAAIIKKVLTDNPGASKVRLVAHSMGGLAARAYLQGLATTQLGNQVANAPYRDDVDRLIMVGTPHRGSSFAEACYDNSLLCGLLPLPVNPNSVAVQDLRPTSNALNELNALAVNLPAAVSYVSVIGTGEPTLVGTLPYSFDDGDGVVSDASQNLATVTGNILLQRTSPRVTIELRPECGYQTADLIPGQTLGETHTCETSDPGVWAQIFMGLR